MFRIFRLTLGTLTALTLLLFLAGPSAVQAHGRAPAGHGRVQPHQRIHQPQGRHYQLYYRRNPNSPWTTYGRFQNSEAARRALESLRRSGIDVFYR